MNRRPGQLESLTSLRYIAAFAVALFHVPFTLTSVTTTPIFIYGAHGVSFFFVLSGFILSHAHPLGEPLQTGEFYLKRFARIYPLHLLTFTVWCYLYWKIWGIPLSDRINSGVANLLLLHAFFSGPLFNLGYNAVSWSLSVELFFYLVFPLFRRPAVAISWVLLHLVFAIALSSHKVASLNDAISTFHYFNPLARVAEFAIGILSYRAFRVLPALPYATLLEIAGLALIVLIVSQLQSIRYLLWYPLLGSAFGFTIVLMAQQRGLLSRFLSWSPLVLLGEASFSFYMIHHMLFRMIDARLAQHIGALPLLVTAFAVTTFVSIGLLFCFERPARRFVLLILRQHPRPALQVDGITLGVSRTGSGN